MSLHLNGDPSICMVLTQDLRITGRMEWAAGGQNTASTTCDNGHQVAAAPARSQGLVTMTSAPVGLDTEQQCWRSAADRSAPSAAEAPAGVRGATAAACVDRGTSTSSAPQQQAASAEACKAGALDCCARRLHVVRLSCCRRMCTAAPRLPVAQADCQKCLQRRVTGEPILMPAQ